jgi:hypothetical protein
VPDSIATICRSVPGAAGSSGNFSPLKTISSLEKLSSWVQRVHIFCTLVVFTLDADLDMVSGLRISLYVLVFM